MVNYDLLILQPSEFECLCRDLLQKRDNIFIESFADGRDKGIDLRFAYDKSCSAIVQCKRYKDWDNLYHNLKKEAGKVKQLNPSRYILSTSVDLSVEQKEKIFSLFQPYIKSDDILGKKDINNLLEQYPQIVRQYHKLWLTSADILDTIVHRKVANQTEWELDRIRDEISKYVENDSLNKALRILEENRYVIISGIPGIGKTTLSRMLIYTLLSNGFDELVSVRSIDDALSVFSKEKRQIFFFDDFLGANYFTSLGGEFESSLLALIQKIRSSNNSIFILATREYILSEALLHYEKLALHKIDISKCTLELSNYTRLIRAKILYNHLVSAEVPNEYIEKLLENHNYDKLINHRNFNPRVIESVIIEKVWESVSPQGFVSRLVSDFDCPDSVWEYAFNKLTRDTRYVLLVFATIGQKILLEDFEKAYRYFCKATYLDVGLIFDDVTWKESLKVLEDCFIKINKKEGQFIVSVHNPSVLDYLINYLKHNNNTVEKLIKGALYIEQLLTVFVDETAGLMLKKYNIPIKDTLFPLFKDSYKRIFDNGFTCKLSDYYFKIKKENFTDTRVLLLLRMKFPEYYNLNRKLIEKEYNIDELSWQTIPLSCRLEVLENIDYMSLGISPKEYLTGIMENEKLDTVEWRILSETINNLNLAGELIDKFYYEKMEDSILDNIKSLSTEEECISEYSRLEDLEVALPNWQSSYNIFSALEDIENEIKEENDDEGEYYTSLSDKYNRWEEQRNKEDNFIYEMFTSLLK